MFFFHKVNLLGVRVGPCGNCQKHVASPAGPTPTAHWTHSAQASRTATSQDTAKVRLQVTGASTRFPSSNPDLVAMGPNDKYSLS
ncbi:hypothetical protein B5X24_HaOG208070 [Helicoverpa armigera]|nr:hypothetical protein B5X24_HaOG208070 [Helicoverpa armigera]